MGYLWPPVHVKNIAVWYPILSGHLVISKTDLLFINVKLPWWRSSMRTWFVDFGWPLVTPPSRGWFYSTYTIKLPFPSLWIPSCRLAFVIFRSKLKGFPQVPSFLTVSFLGHVDQVYQKTHDIASHSIMGFGFFMTKMIVIGVEEFVITWTLLELYQSESGELSSYYRLVDFN